MSEAGLVHLRLQLGERAQPNVPLAPRTTFRIGGPADLLAEAKTIPELIEFVKLARQSEVPVWMLGNGSNILVRDGGIRGLVVENQCDQSWLSIAEQGRAILHAESGVALPNIANRMARQGWSGLEWAVGVPGTLGGAIVGNAGAHGACIADSVLKVSMLDQASVARELPKNELAFNYRTSWFKQTKGEIILSAELELKRDDPPACIARMNDFTQQRRRTQPVEHSVGSIFKNPPGHFAGRLIDQAGLKGARVGKVEVSTTHANFFVNQGGASADDVLRLIDLVRERVREKFNVQLELEIEIIGN
jgi:UDP-N-acetylmuramate dehydrogenase